jgi:hypothetical protein
MSTLKVKLATAAFAALLGAGLVVAPHEVFAAGSKNPCAPKAANPCAAKESGKPDMTKDKDKSGMSRGKFDYPLLPDYLAEPQG